MKRPEAAKPAASDACLVDGAPITSMEVEVDGLSVHTRVARPMRAADRPPLVLVHGLSISSAYMVPFARLLASELEVYAPDFPGFGHSEKPEDVMDIPALADFLGRWMDAVGIRRASLLANSLGCQVVAEFAAREPSRVDRLVLVAPTMDPASETKDLVLGLLKDAALEKPSLLAVHAADDVRAGPLRTWQTFQHGLNHDMEASLARVQAPTLVVRGTRDPLVSSGWAERVASLVAQGSLVELEDATHAINYSDPERLVAVVRPFLLEQAVIADA